MFQRGSNSNIKSVIHVGLSSFIFELFVNERLFAPFPTLSPLLIWSDRCLEDCVGTHVWIVGFSSCRGIYTMVTVETPACPRHPSSIQQEARCLNSLISHQDFGWTVLHCATKCGKLSPFLHVCRWSKVNQLDVKFVIQNDILIL